MMKRAFSLVELSIVLVILGLLVGGILAGQSLIRAAELRAVGSEYQRWMTATMAFRDKYFATPGDMTNATAIWGRQTASGCVTNSSATVSAAGVCDGDGDGFLSYAGTNVIASEGFQFWRQMALAGLVQGSYTGFSTGTVSASSDSTNIPSSLVSKGLWFIYYAASYSSTGSVFDGDYGHHFRMAGYNVGDLPKVDLFRPEEMWNIDTKIDDGKPALGKVVVRCSGGIGVCTTTVLTTNSNANYLLTNSSIAGSLMIRKLF